MIEDYFRGLLAQVEASPVIRSHQIVFDKRGPDTGYVRGDIYFIDESRLHLRESINTELGVERFSYTYHYQRADGTLVFRYDDSPHYPTC